MWTSLRLLLVPSVLLCLTSVCAAWFVCPGICRCFPDAVRCNNVTERSVPASQKGVYRRIVLKHLVQSTISSLSFDGLTRVQRIEIAQSVTLETIETLAFNNLLNLTEINIQNVRSLVHIGKRTFNNLPKLRYLSISNTGIDVFPDLTSVHSLEPDFMLYICDNLHLLTIPPNTFVGMARDLIIMNLFNNGLREIQDHAFNGTKLEKLVLKNNRGLKVIHSGAFRGAEGPWHLDVSSTAIETLPSKGLEQLHELVAQGTFGLKSLPALWALREAQLTYNSHCCALSPDRDEPVKTAWDNGSAYSLYDSDPSPRVLGVNAASPYDLDLPEDSSYGDTEEYTAFKCSPAPDAFNPCEDLAGFSFLRVAVWFISLLAVTGNLTVLLVISTSRNKLTVPRFLMCHLAFADFCIGVYLLMIATVDVRTRGRYGQHAIEWQTGPGCRAAGFLSVFGGELSVYTLAAITLERWHTITHAMRLERRLGLGKAAGVMAGGWLACLGMALLPLVGVSSYSKVGMCLPMDVHTSPAQAFILLLLLFNVAAFLVVCVCYVLIYLAVRNPEFPGRSADAMIAKRMAVLVFTDLVCMAPISFFAISAAFKVPLITVTNSKILLVLFFPINSCANPFLYAIFTRAFRRDAYLALSVLGCCGESRANMYRMKAYCSENVIKVSFGGSNNNSTALRGAEVTQQSCPLNAENRPKGNQAAVDS